MHIKPYDNENKPIVGADDARVPLVYMNIVTLKKGESFRYAVEGYETCCVPVHGTSDFHVGGETFKAVGARNSLWEGDPSAVYVPAGMEAEFTCVSDDTEVFVAGAKFAETLAPFVVRPDEIDHVQYGSDDTKTHRKIKHILGQRQKDKVGRLLVSELFTVGAGGWSGFPPHKHCETRLPGETRHDEVYNFRFNPEHGFGAQFLQHDGDEFGEVFHVKNRSSFAIDQGYHPCVAAPGYEMYYFTILGGETQRPLVQHFQPEHAYQIETIPGIKDMIAKFK